MSRRVRLGSWTIQPHKEQWDVSARWKHSPVSFGTEYSLLVHECHCLVTDACAGPRQCTTSLSFDDEMRLFIRFRLHVLKLLLRSDLPGHARASRQKRLACLPERTPPSSESNRLCMPKVSATP
jgi:hypothetical protein